jgi:hypothetical protein
MVETPQSDACNKGSAVVTTACVLGSAYAVEFRQGSVGKANEKCHMPRSSIGRRGWVYKKSTPHLWTTLVCFVARGGGFGPFCQHGLRPIRHPRIMLFSPGHGVRLSGGQSSPSARNLHVVLSRGTDGNSTGRYTVTVHACHRSSSPKRLHVL